MAGVGEEGQGGGMEEEGAAGTVTLRAQLKPLSTPALRWRLQSVFGEATDADAVPREAVLQRLLAAYAAAQEQQEQEREKGGSLGGSSNKPAARRAVVVEEPGVALPRPLAARLLAALQAVPWEEGGGGDDDEGDGDDEHEH